VRSHEQDFHRQAIHLNTYDTTWQRVGDAYQKTAELGRSTVLKPGTTTYAYNAASHLTGVSDSREGVKNRQFATDLHGRILEKTSYTTDASGRLMPHRERTLVVNGQKWGTSGDDKTEQGRAGTSGTRKAAEYVPDGRGRSSDVTLVSSQLRYDAAGL
jgi:YD repeat-containing protein